MKKTFLRTMIVMAVSAMIALAGYWIVQASASNLSTTMGMGEMNQRLAASENRPEPANGLAHIVGQPPDGNLENRPEPHEGTAQMSDQPQEGMMDIRPRQGMGGPSRTSSLWNNLAKIGLITAGVILVQTVAKWIQKHHRKTVTATQA